MIKLKNFITIIMMVLTMMFLSCSKSIEGDIDDGLEIVGKMESALKLAKDQNPKYEEKMKNAEDELFTFMAEMREKYSNEEYNRIDRTLQKEMDVIMQKMMNGY